jgi:hypothetical protein
MSIKFGSPVAGFGPGPHHSTGAKSKAPLPAGGSKPKPKPYSGGSDYKPLSKMVTAADRRGPFGKGNL